MANQGSMLKVRGVNINLARAGSGRPVLFLHGAGGVAGWPPFFESLSRRYQLLVPDHPGFGHSDDPPWIRNVPDAAMFYLDFIDALQIDQIHLVGHSLGGWIAAELAVRDCARLASLTLIAPAGIRVKGVPSGDSFIWSPEEAAHNLFADPALARRMLDAPVSDEEADIMLKNRYAAAKYGWQPRWFNPDLEKWLHRIKVPTHLVWGAADQLMPVAYCDLWRERVAGARVTLLDNCGHLPHIEKSEVVATRIESFWNEVAV
jgi:pimeloyl-ACP methyl ester carboxylesterase